MTLLSFAKLHAAGNDFVVIAHPELYRNGDEHASDVGATGVDDLAARTAAFVAIDSQRAVALLDRHHGIGGDTLLLLSGGADGADARMVQFESDGTMAEMTGNGIRCLAYVADQLGLSREDQVVVDTLAGHRTVTLQREGGRVRYATVAMGAAAFEPERIPLDAPSSSNIVANVDGVTYVGDAVSVGNPHVVFVVDDVEVVPVAMHGAILEHDARFPKRVNVHWVTVVQRNRVRMRTWERGVGVTLACGTGATAAAAVLHRRGVIDDSVTFEVPGGELTVAIGTELVLGGPVVHIYDGVIDLTTVNRVTA